MQKPELELVYEAQGSLGAPIPLGDTVDGTRRIIPIFQGGRVEGPLIKGALLGDAADWQLTRPDGVTVAEAIYALRTDDGVVIQIRNRGLRQRRDVAGYGVAMVVVSLDTAAGCAPVRVRGAVWRNDHDQARREDKETKTGRVAN